ncbi:MAG TPA: ABC transporter permease [Gaiellaceae bacterium]|nr:ABC transporter permease [Gaiellaceae bacterium]
MLGYVIRRTLWAVVLCFALSVITFVLFYVVPTNSFRLRGVGVTDLGHWTQLNGSVVHQYVQWLSHVAHGSLGRSFVSRREVADTIGDAVPVTLSLTIGGALLWLLIALPLGVYSAMRPRSAIDRGASVLVFVGLSVHPLWLALVLSYVLGFRAGVLPQGGYCDFFNPSTDCGGAAQWASHLILPWITVALVFSALYTRMIRASVTELMHEDYVRQARAKGLSEWQAVRAHVLPSALTPVVTMLALDIGRLILPTALFVEPAFGLPGLGRIFYQSVLRSDLPMIVGIIVVMSVAAVVANLVADLATALIDPRLAAA